MAAIEKIYGTVEQYDEFYNWAKENNPGILGFFYDRPSQPTETAFAMTLFPEEVDKWLLENCPINWVTKYIKYQYELDNIHDYMSFMGYEDE